MTVSAGDVLDALQATVDAHFPAYLAARNAERGWSLPPIVFSAQQAIPDARIPSQLPALNYHSPGFGGDVEIGSGAGKYDATWLCVITVYARGVSGLSATRTVHEYVALIRDAVLQHTTLGGFADTAIPVDEHYDEAEDAQSLTFGIGSVAFDVTVPDALDRYGAPIDNFPTVVLETDITVTRED